MPRYAQHFLVNPDAIERIVAALEIGPNESVLEIGPGKGALTALLVQVSTHLTAIEIDPAMAAILQEKFGNISNFRLIAADFLDMELGSLPGPMKVVGNLPYNITSPILRKLCAWPGWSSAVLMVQKEMGERLCAAPGGKSYGAITVGVNLSCTVRPIFVLSPHSFRPPPKIESMVIRLDRRPVPLTDDINAVQKVIQAAFQQRRKTMINALSHGLGLTKEEIQFLFEELGLSPQARAETIPVDQYVQLAKMLRLKTVD